MFEEKLKTLIDVLIKQKHEIYEFALLNCKDKEFLKKFEEKYQELHDTLETKIIFLRDS